MRSVVPKSHYIDWVEKRLDLAVKRMLKRVIVDKRHGGFDAVQVAKDFPILQRKVHGKRLAFLDSGASAQKPAVVIEAMEQFLRTNYSNVHRGLYTLSQESSELYENTREKVAQFLKTDPRQVIFVRGVTEGINLVAQTWGRANLKKRVTRFYSV